MQHHGKFVAMNLALDDVLLFTRMADLGSLSAAARERDAPVSQVTRALKRLEAGCGVRLLHRNTHGMHLTDGGDTFLAYARRMLDSTAELAADIQSKRARPSGWVRVSVSALLTQCVMAPSAHGLYQRYPDLQLDIHADDRMADLARDGIDIALRTRTPAHPHTRTMTRWSSGRLARMAARCTPRRCIWPSSAHPPRWLICPNTG